MSLTFYRSLLSRCLVAASVIACGGAAAIAQTPAPADDKYIWLEGPEDAQALAWSAAQTAKSTALLKRDPLYAELRSELDSFMVGSPASPVYQPLGKLMLRARKDKDHPHGLIDAAALVNGRIGGPWRPLLDVGSLKTAAGGSYDLNLDFIRDLCLPAPVGRCLLALSPGGGDPFELREFDLASGSFVTDGYVTKASHIQAAWLDKDTLVIGHTQDGDPAFANGWPRSFHLWKRGTPLAAAPVVYTGEEKDSLIFARAVGAGGDRSAILTRAIDYGTLEFRQIHRSGQVDLLPLPNKLLFYGFLAGNARYLLAQTTQPSTIEGKSYPAETVVTYDLGTKKVAASRVATLSRPNAEVVFNDLYQGFAGAGDDFYIVGDEHLVKHVYRASPKKGGWTLKSVMTAPAGESLTFPAYDLGAPGVVVRRAGLKTPASQSIIGKSGALNALHAAAPLMDLSGYVTEVQQARSRDGTMIDFYLLRPANAKTGKPVPTLMTGYGGFGVSWTPGYFDHRVGGQSLALWLKRGGALAVPIIRGGGERGAAWHHAGAQRAKQNGFDDFIAVAEKLTASGFTDKAHLGVFGSSYGGLLAATVAVERPDLFGAAVADAPVLDMVRYMKMGIGAGLRAEFGDPDDPEDRAAILRYSPYQKLVAGKAFPPIMITVSTNDTRVGVGHSRKFAARLAEVGGTPLLVEVPQGGHGVSDPASNPELMTMRMTFLISTLMK